MDSNSRPAAQGWVWIVEAWALFTRAPWPWVLITVVYAVILVALHFLWVVGALAAGVLWPVFAGGVMLGCRQLQQGGALEIGSLFAGFRTRFGALASVGAVSLVASLAIVYAVSFATGGTLLVVMNREADLDLQAIAAAAGTLLLALLIIAALLLPVAMAIWFAPPLVVLQGKGALEAMVQSFIACLKNTLPFLVYGLVLLVLSILAMFTAGLGWLVLGPVVAASVYTSYRDIFPS